MRFVLEVKPQHAVKGWARHAWEQTYPFTAVVNMRRSNLFGGRFEAGTLQLAAVSTDATRALLTFEYRQEGIDPIVLEKKRFIGIKYYTKKRIVIYKRTDFRDLSTFIFLNNARLINTPEKVMSGDC